MTNSVTFTNGNTYRDEKGNDPTGNYLSDGGFRIHLVPMFADTVQEVALAVTASEASVVAQGLSEAARDTTLGYRDQSEAFKIAAEAASVVAVAAAASADFPFVTSSGTSTAYTANFSPDRTVGDGFSMRVNFHTACGATPTMSVDGGTAYEIVDGGSFTSGGAFRPLDANDIRTGMNLILTYDSTVGKFVITGNFPIYELSRDLKFNGYGYTYLRTYENFIIVQGELKDGEVAAKVWFTSATRLYNIKRKSSTGTINVTFNKNGSTDINFGVSPSTTVAVTSTLTEVAVNHSGNAYIDFAEGDYMKITFASNSAAQNFFCKLDMEENRV